MNKKLLFLLGGIFLISCQEKEDEIISSQTKLRVNHEILPAQESLENVCAFLYDADILSSKMINMQSETDGLYMLHTDNRKTDKVYFLAGDHSVDAQTSVSNLSDLINMKTAPVDYINTKPSLFYTGDKSLNWISDGTVNIDLTRSVARLDLNKLTQLNVVIDSCVITNLPDRSFILPGNTNEIEGLEYKKYSLPATAFTGINDGITGFAYLYESRGANIEVVFYLRLNGVKNVLKAKLPDVIDRNMRYQIGIDNNGAALFTNLDVEPWGDGSNTVTKPEEFIPTINLETSQLPQGVRISTTKDTVYVASDFGDAFILGIDAPIDTEVKMSSNNVQVTPVAPVKSNDIFIGNRFQLTFSESQINDPTLYMKLYVKSKNSTDSYSQYITVVKESFRLRMGGLSGKTVGKVIDFEGYKDGLLARLYSDYSIQHIETASTDDQFDWIRVNDTDEGLLLEGAFKPNDLNATGQSQVSTLRVVYADNFTEEYTLKRQRYSLPVVQLGGLYWAKYNMRGNSKSYDDQIRLDQDVDDFSNFLRTCTDREYVYYGGAVYKGHSTSGLYLKNENGALRYEGYSSIPSAHINNGPADFHCPSGYQIPSQDEFSQIVATHVHMWLNNPGSSNHYTTPSNGRRYRLERFRRDSIMIDGLAFKNADHVVLTDIHRNESIVLNGFGRQYNNTTTWLTNWILALVNTGGINYYEINMDQGRMAIIPQGSENTRIVRCVKSPVNFIVEE